MRNYLRRLLHRLLNKPDILGHDNRAEIWVFGAVDLTGLKITNCMVRTGDYAKTNITHCVFERWPSRANASDIKWAIEAIENDDGEWL